MYLEQLRGPTVKFTGVTLPLDVKLNFTVTLSSLQNTLDFVHVVGFIDILKILFIQLDFYGLTRSVDETVRYRICCVTFRYTENLFGPVWQVTLSEDVLYLPMRTR